MNNDYHNNQYGQQFGYDHYDMPQGQPGMKSKFSGLNLKQKMKSPVFATVSLLAAGVAFAAIIYSTYPVGSSDEAVPIVRAETFAYKQTPSEPGGMEIPNRDTTIFQTMADAPVNEARPVENLLAQEEPVDKLAAFQRQVEEISAQEAASEAAGSETSADEEISTNVASIKASDEETAPVELKKIVAAEPAQETLAASEPEVPAEPVTIAAAPSERPSSERPEIEHAPGSNPETLAYVRSVLDRKDGIPPSPTTTAAAEDTSTSVNGIEPAAGLSAGSYYAQLGSVTSESGAESEWGKLQKAFASELSSMDYRVEKADLGEKGIYYRIQAGPLSKEGATSVCDAIKAQKPGGCLVTQ